MGNKFRPSLYSKKMELLNPIKRPLSLPLSLTARTSNFAVLILSRLFSLFDEKLEFYFRKIVLFLLSDGVRAKWNQNVFD